MSFEKVCANPNYLTHYTARHTDFNSAVIVVLWGDYAPGPAIIHDGKPILYVYHRHVESGEFSSWNKNPPSYQCEDTEREINEATHVKEVISQNQNELFSNHSNLVAVHPVKSSDRICIQFVVVAKHFRPVKDSKPLPREIEGIPTKVCSGWMNLTGNKELKKNRPLLPGAGIGVGCDALLNLNVSEDDYILPALGTLGGWYQRNGQIYGVTCAHCVLSDVKQNILLPQDTPVYQPCAMGLILHQVNVHEDGAEFLQVHERMSQFESSFNRMKKLTNKLNFFPDVTDTDECGRLFGAVFGPLNNGGTVVDVALVKMTELNLAETCHAFDEIVSPILRLGDNGTQILELNSFPKKSFKVYGKGARSSGIMISNIDPIQNEIYFRQVQPDDTNGLVFHCIHSLVEQNWRKGDSGTWCWTEAGELIGMGMAYTTEGGKVYCCILPMSDVERAIDQILENTEHG